MNFSHINDLDWAAPEDQWNSQIKPQIIHQIDQMKAVVPLGTPERKLAWSTLEEYMNFPLDTPSENSPYVIKVRRIIEVTKEENLPVFIPLNGFQWWDQLPELYNWWDNDGTHTPQAFFARQKTPDFKERFIKGYNPDNKWNVEWQNYQTPMQVNNRNWGGGGFYVAPPPNLVNHTKTKLTYRSVLDGRFIAIVTEINKQVQELQKEGKQDLFAGMSIGTEVSLNASVTPDSFLPYGFRGIQDTLCPQDKPTCGVTYALMPTQVQEARETVVKDYLTDLAKIAVSQGIPKQRVYTHVWGETKEGQPDFVDYAAAAVNNYSRPGMSFYGFANDPLSLPVWKSALETNGSPSWGGVEYSAGVDGSAWQHGLTNTFTNTINPGKIIVIYNWDEQKNTASIPVISQFLQSTAFSTACQLPEILVQGGKSFYDPQTLVWSYLSPHFFPNVKKTTLHIAKDGQQFVKDVKQITLASPEDTRYQLASLAPGIYDWYVEIDGCDNKKQTSVPQRIGIPYSVTKNGSAFWVNTVYSLYQRLTSLR